MARRFLARFLALALMTPSVAFPQAGGAADLEKGIRLTREGDFEAAVTALLSAVKQLGAPAAAKDLARAYTYLGVAHLNMGQDAVARADFQAALKADPKLTLSSSEFPPKVTQAFAAARTAAGLPAATAPAATGPSIDHSPLKCLEENLFPEVRAAVQSPASVQKSRVYFKAHQFPDWYYVEMATDAVPNYLGTLPKPLPGTAKVDYYVYALDSQLQTTQTSEYDPDVSKACRRDAAAVTQKDPRITLYGTKAGQAAIPPGFDKTGIIAFVTVAGAVIAGAALAGGSAAAAGAAGAGAAGAGSGSAAGAAAGGAAGGGGGMSATTIGLIAGGVVAAGAAVAVAAGGGGDEDPLAVDNDGDGVSENAGDCNDGNAQINPNGQVTFTNARFPTATINCTSGQGPRPLNIEISVDGVNNRCSATNVSAQVTYRVEASRNTNDTPGETFNGGSPSVSPASIGPGASANQRVRTSNNCFNPPGAGSGTTDISAQVTLTGSFGSVELRTSNRLRVVFP